ncbi:hypothetical protein BGW36DRAFT_290029 [Talaromyces proteolyticus]|uniref:DUF8035 domain-containing protein n=1 Tax=Talaromyces proteolyticus TaxID=1131652 RepID=A0AAD4L0Q0_9EURO|nr:uncharacterized protein BGW36DRAFT_290029 [Talaromyces proteolyticus]KAH8701730.1 hypothetical protein BGW36DRAFT_290029 [Talaromyces proteolyticus]
MTHSSRHRSDSPGSRRLYDPMRASTGTVSTDVYASPTSYHSHDGLLSAKTAERRGGFFTADTRDHVDVRPISTTTYRDANHATKSRTEYAVRPRSHTAVDSKRNPLSLVIPSTSSRSGGTVSAYDRSTSPLPPRASYSREDPERYITPSSSGRAQRRVYSSDYTSDSGYLEPPDHARGHRDQSYRIYRPGGVSHYPAYGDPRKWDDSRYYDAYSYTNARETFEKESAARSSQRTSRRTGRPLSMTATELATQSSYGRDSRRPPPSQRGFDRLPGEDRLRITSGRDYPDSEITNRETRKLTYPRAPVLHQDREDGYYSYTDDQKDSRRHRHRPRHRDSLRHAEKLLTPVITGLASLGLASGYSDDGRDAERFSRSEKYRSRESEYGHDRDKDYDRDHRDKGRDKALPGDERERQYRHHRERSQRRDHSSDYSSSELDTRTPRREKSSSRKHHDSGDSDKGTKQRSKDESLKVRSSRRDDISEVFSRRSVAEDGSEERPRKPVTVEPPVAKEPEAPPKSILKAPREKFPEEDNPIREGVAPLKDAHKKGIPPGARWTKIDRRLVNPAALELGHERFEERSEYVIVLRVLTKEEIQAYAVKTQEIRDERYKAAKEERLKAREERHRNGKNDSSSSDDEDEEDEPAPLAIEGAPAEDDFPVPRDKDRLTNKPVAEAAKAQR